MKPEDVCPRCGKPLRWESHGARESGWCECSPHGPVVDRPATVRRKAQDRSSSGRAKVTTIVGEV